MSGRGCRWSYWRFLKDVSIKLSVCKSRQSKQEMLPPRKIAVAEARGSSPPRLSGGAGASASAGPLSPLPRPQLHQHTTTSTDDLHSARESCSPPRLLFSTFFTLLVFPLALLHTGSYRPLHFCPPISSLRRRALKNMSPVRSCRVLLVPATATVTLAILQYFYLP
jgi:hypothetical protein